MAVAQLDIDSLLDALNDARSRGRFLTNDILIRQIRNKTEALRDQFVPYHLHMASLYCLTGNYEQMNHHGRIAVKFLGPKERAFHCVNLTTAGYITEARTLYNGLGDADIITEDMSSYDLGFVIQALADCFLYNKASEILTNHHLTFEKPIHEVDRLLQSQAIDEGIISSMLDIAGDFLRQRQLFSADGYIVNPNQYDQTISIGIPLNLPTEEIVALEWDFIEKLFNEMPDAPFNQVHIGFCSST